MTITIWSGAQSSTLFNILIGQILTYETKNITPHTLSYDLLVLQSNFDQHAVVNSMMLHTISVSFNETKVSSNPHCTNSNYSCRLLGLSCFAESCSLRAKYQSRQCKNKTWGKLNNKSEMIWIIYTAFFLQSVHS